MAQNDFLQFDENNENVLTQDAYREDEQRISGAKSGVARSSLFNKVLRQVSTFVAGFGQFISEKNINVLEDIDSVKNALTNVLSSKNIGVSAEVQELLGANNVDDGLKFMQNIDSSWRFSTLITSANKDSIDTALGKGNEENCVGLGIALVEYAWFKGDDKLTNPFTNLRKVTNINNLNSGIVEEISNSEVLQELLNKTNYGKNILSYCEVVRVILSIGYSIEHSSVKDYMNDDNVLVLINNNLNTFLSNSECCDAIFGYKKSFDSVYNLLNGASSDVITIFKNNLSNISNSRYSKQINSNSGVFNFSKPIFGVYVHFYCSSSVSAYTGNLTGFNNSPSISVTGIPSSYQKNLSFIDVADANKDIKASINYMDSVTLEYLIQPDE